GSAAEKPYSTPKSARTRFGSARLRGETGPEYGPGPAFQGGNSPERRPLFERSRCLSASVKSPPLRVWRKGFFVFWGRRDPGVGARQSRRGQHARRPPPQRLKP